MYKGSLEKLCPPMHDGESVYSWVVRTADSHLLTLNEMKSIIGGEPSSLDCGDTTFLDNLSQATGVEAEVIRDAMPTDLTSNPMRWYYRPNHALACEQCLREDLAQGREYYLRASWNHPLSVSCGKHRDVLMPISYPFKCYRTHLGRIDKDPAKEFRESWLIERRNFLRQILDQLSDFGAIPSQQNHSMSLRNIVSDLVDALRVERRPNVGTLKWRLNFALGRMNRLSTPSLRSGGLSYLPPFPRLRQVLLARALLEKDNQLSPPLRHFVEDGLENYSIKPVDPLAALAFGLPGPALEAFTSRTERWPDDLRDRWLRVKDFGR